MIAIDSTPLIHLSKIGRLDILENCSLITTESVRGEVVIEGKVGVSMLKEFFKRVEVVKLLEEDIVSGYKIIDYSMLAGMDMPGPFGAGKRNYKKWTEILEDFVEKSGLDYLSTCNLMKSGKFIEMRK